MTLELRSIRYRVGATNRVAAAIEEALPSRAALSPLAAFLTVEVGPLNSAVEMFWYPDRDERDRVNAASEALEDWPVAHPDITQMGETLVLEDAPFNEPLRPGSYGKVYELRHYEYPAGSIGPVLEAWAEKMEWRRSLSPALGAWYLTGGPTDVYYHLWAYEDAAQREEIRAAASATGNWPPRAAVSAITQENLLARPASFSPIS